MYISNVQHQDAGRYICICHTNDGQQFESEYLLTIEDEPARQEIKPARIEHADAGSFVVLQCQPDHYSNRFHWTRQHGHFAPGQDISSVSCNTIFGWHHFLSRLDDDLLSIDFHRVNCVWRMYKQKMQAFIFVQQAVADTVLTFQQRSW